MSTRKLTAAEVRKLPIGSAVTLHKHDKYGYPATLECNVERKLDGSGKELVYNSYYGLERMPIRTTKSQYFTVRE